MAKLTIHESEETIDELEEELPRGVQWGEYILECIQLRKRVESRELVLTEPETDTVEEKR